MIINVGELLIKAYIDSKIEGRGVVTVKGNMAYVITSPP